MAKKIIFDDQSINEIINRYNNDLSCAEIAKLYNCSAQTIKKILLNNNICVRPSHFYSRKIKHFNENYFSEIDTEDKAYFLGLLYADGNVGSSNNVITLKLIEKDRYILSKMSNMIFNQDITGCQEYKKYSYGKNASNMAYLKFSSKTIKDDLIRHGCVPRKSLVLNFPITVPDNLLNHFIRGYFDGDGCITYCLNKHNKLDFRFEILSTKYFCDNIKNVIYLNSNTNMKVSKTKSKVFKCGSGGNRKILNIFYWLYRSANLYLTRKYDRFCLLKQQCNEIDRIIPNRYNRH